MIKPLWSDEKIAEWVQEHKTWPSDFAPDWSAVGSIEVLDYMRHMRDDYEFEIVRLNGVQAILQQGLEQNNGSVAWEHAKGENP